MPARRGYEAELRTLHLIFIWGSRIGSDSNLPFLDSALSCFVGCHITCHLCAEFGTWSRSQLPPDLVGPHSPASSRTSRFEIGRRRSVFSIEVRWVIAPNLAAAARTISCSGIGPHASSSRPQLFQHPRPLLRPFLPAHPHIFLVSHDVRQDGTT